MVLIYSWIISKQKERVRGTVSKREIELESKRERDRNKERISMKAHTYIWEKK